MAHRDFSRVAVLVEQGACSGANFLAFVLLARCMPPTEWGGFAFAYAIIIFVQGFQRSMVVLPMISFSSHGAWQGAERFWQRRNMLLTTLVFLALLLTWIVARFFGLGWFVHSALYSSLMVVPIFLMEFFKRSSIQRADYLGVALAGIAYGVAMLSGALVVVTINTSAWVPVSAVSLGAFSYSLIVWVRRSRENVIEEFFEVPFRQYLSFSSWASLGHLAFSGYNFCVQAILGAVAGPVAVGVFHSTRTLVQPVNTFVGAMDSIDKPRAAVAYAREGFCGLAKEMVRSLILLLAVAGPYAMVLFLFSSEILGFVYDGKFDDYQKTLWLWAVIGLCMTCAHVGETGLYVTKMTRGLFWGRLVASVFGLLIAYFSVDEYGVYGALVAVLTGFFCSSISSAYVIHRARGIRS